MATSNDPLTTAAKAIVGRLDTLITVERDRNEYLRELVELERSRQAPEPTVKTLGQAER